MNDNINELGKYLRETDDRTDAALSRYIQPRARIERVRDVFDSVISFDMYFNTERDDQRVMLDLFFQEPIPCHNDICSACETYEADQDYPYGTLIVTTTHSYIAGSVTAYKNGVAVAFSEVSPQQGKVKIKAYVFLGDIITICYNNKEDSTTTKPPPPEDYTCCEEWRDDFSVDSIYNWGTMLTDGGWGKWWAYSPGYGINWSENGLNYMNNSYGTPTIYTQQITGGLLTSTGTAWPTDAWQPPYNFSIVAKFKFISNVVAEMINFSLGISFWNDTFDDYWGGDFDCSIWNRAQDGGPHIQLAEANEANTAWSGFVRKSIPFFTPDEFYLIKIERINSTSSAYAHAKYWKESEPEPSEWAVEISNLPILTPRRFNRYVQIGSTNIVSEMAWDYIFIQSLDTDCEGTCTETSSSLIMFDDFTNRALCADPWSSPWNYLGKASHSDLEWYGDDVDLCVDGNYLVWNNSAGDGYAFTAVPWEWPPVKLGPWQGDAFQVKIRFKFTGIISGDEGNYLALNLRFKPASSVPPTNQENSFYIWIQDSGDPYSPYGYLGTTNWDGYTYTHGNRLWTNDFINDTFYYLLAEKTTTYSLKAKLWKEGTEEPDWQVSNSPLYVGIKEMILSFAADHDLQGKIYIDYVAFGPPSE